MTGDLFQPFRKNINPKNPKKYNKKLGKTQKSPNFWLGSPWYNNEGFSNSPIMNPKSYSSRMKQNSSTELWGHSFLQIYNKNGTVRPIPQTPVDPNSDFFLNPVQSPYRTPIEQTLGTLGLLFSFFFRAIFWFFPIFLRFFMVFLGFIFFLNG